MIYVNKLNSLHVGIKFKFYNFTMFWKLNFGLVLKLSISYWQLKLTLTSHLVLIVAQLFLYLFHIRFFSISIVLVVHLCVFIAANNGTCLKVSNQEIWVKGIIFSACMESDICHDIKFMYFFRVLNQQSRNCDILQIHALEYASMVHLFMNGIFFSQFI